ncbi:HET-domain-containing protein [Stipitochalara longipes BDJ]|nr:HET-domain-containing protein [Stipitochalara longipes BDJ]
MLCSSCQDIFKKPEFFAYVTTETQGKYLHSKYTKSIRDAAHSSCRIYTMLCLHFDSGVKSFAENTASAESWKQATGWMKECFKQHVLCNQPMPGRPWWSTRLLNIRNFNDKHDIKLIETKDTIPSGPYITLSHRWGSAEFIKLTEESSNQLRDGFVLEDLSQTFRDAVAITLRLGISYLWIDSLCIIQDSVDDWSKEASQMSDVYHHALCNIAATGALDSSRGIFASTDLSVIQPWKIPLPDPRVGEVKNFYIVDSSFWEYRVMDAPLMKRAWVVQEQLLARRILHFCQDQLYWECREKSACEVFPKQMPPCIMSRGRFKDVVPKTDAKYWRPDLKNSTFLSGSPDVVWRRIVGHYSRAELTKTSDKEAALNGIVKMLEGVFDDICIDKLSAKPCEVYRAPSWSWLSIDGEVVTYCSTLLDLPSVDIDAIEITRAGNSPISPITAGIMKLTGLIRHVTWKAKRHPQPVLLQFEDQKSPSLLGWMDNVAFRSDQSAWIIQIRIRFEDKKLFGQGLILRRKIDGTFCRIGYFESEDEDTMFLISQERQDKILEANNTERNPLRRFLSGLSVKDEAQTLDIKAQVEMTRSQWKTPTKEERIVII